MYVVMIFINEEEQALNLINNSDSKNLERKTDKKYLKVANRQSQITLKQWLMMG